MSEPIPTDRLLAGIEWADQWPEVRDRLRSRWLDAIGGVPEPVPVELEFGAAQRQRHHISHTVRFATAHGDHVQATVLVPHDSVPGRGPDGRRAGVVALHPTHPDGRDSVVRPTGPDGRRYGLELAERGYVVLAPDADSVGSRTYPGHRSFHNGPLLRSHPHWSGVGKNITDHIQAVSALAEIDGVAADRIGAIGHSFGGYNSVFLAGLVPRVRAVVSSCGLNPLRDNPDAAQWGVRDWYTLLPAVNRWLEAGHFPLDLDEVTALVAPTPMFTHVAQLDQYHRRWPAVAAALAELRQLYDRLGQLDRFAAYMSVGPHDFPDPIREISYRFLDRWLRGEGQTVDPPRRVNDRDVQRNDLDVPLVNGEPLTGELVETMPDGRLLSLTSYVRGQLEGPFRAWSGAGVLVVEGQGHHGRTVGEQREWFNDGTPKFQRRYDERGELIALRQWDQAGRLIKDKRYPPPPH